MLAEGWQDPSLSWSRKVAEVWWFIYCDKQSCFCLLFVVVLVFMFFSWFLLHLYLTLFLLWTVRWLLLSLPKVPAFSPNCMALLCKRYTFTPFISLVDPLFNMLKNTLFSCASHIVFRFPYSLWLLLLFFLIQAMDIHWYLIWGERVRFKESTWRLVSLQKLLQEICPLSFILIYAVKHKYNFYTS